MLPASSLLPQDRVLPLCGLKQTKYSPSAGGFRGASYLSDHQGLLLLSYLLSVPSYALVYTYFMMLASVLLPTWLQVLPCPGWALGAEGKTGGGEGAPSFLSASWKPLVLVSISQTSLPYQ